MRNLSVLLALVMTMCCAAPLMAEATGTGAWLLSLGEQERAWYIFGVYDGIIQADKIVRWRIANKERTKMDSVGSLVWITPPDLTYGQVEKIVINYLAKHPDQLTASASMLIYTAIQEATKSPWAIPVCRAWVWRTGQTAPTHSPPWA